MVSLILATAVASPLTVSVQGMEGVDGTLIVAACDTRAKWLDLSTADHVARVPARKAAEPVVFDVVPGSWAVWVIHDRDDSGDLDMRWFPIPGPAEPSGVSNGVRPRMGPPRFADAAVAVPPEGLALVVPVE